MSDKRILPVDKYRNNDEFAMVVIDMVTAIEKTNLNKQEIMDAAVVAAKIVAEHRERERKE